MLLQTHSGNQSGILWHGIKMNQKRNQNFENTLLKQTTLYSVFVLSQRMSHLGLNLNILLTLTLPGPSTGVIGSLDSYCSLKPLCSGMGEVVPARTSPTLLPPSPRTVLPLSCFKVLQCINCRDWHCKS